MNPILVAIAIAGGLFLGILLCIELGYRIGKANQGDPGEVRAGVGPIEGAIFALLGLLLAFSFSASADRFNTRRVQIVERRGAARDHPVLTTLRETRYLKLYVLRVVD